MEYYQCIVFPLSWYLTSHRSGEKITTTSDRIVRSIFIPPVPFEILAQPGQIQSVGRYLPIFRSGHFCHYFHSRVSSSALRIGCIVFWYVFSAVRPSSLNSTRVRGTLPAKVLSIFTNPSSSSFRKLAERLPRVSPVVRVKKLKSASTTAASTIKILRRVGEWIEELIWST